MNSITESEAEQKADSKIAPRHTDKLAKKLCSDTLLKTNSINAARLILAMLVLYSHSYALERVENTEPLVIWTQNQISAAGMAVAVFFILSGFLIVRSWLQLGEMRLYLQHRILRIHPGFIVASVISILVAALSCHPISSYFHDLPKKSFLEGLIDLHYGAMDYPQGSFPGNPFHAVNGALWTIPIEFACYAAVAGWGIFGLYKYRWLGAAVVAALSLNYEHKVFQGIVDVNKIWGLSCCFGVGGTLYLFRDRVPRSGWLALASLVALVAGAIKSPWLCVVFPFAVTYLTFYIVMAPVPKWLAWTQKTDLSYGVYLYAFLIQQSLIHWLHMGNPTLLTIVAMIITIGAATASWFLVEKPCLRLKRFQFKDGDPAIMSK